MRRMHKIIFLPATTGLLAVGLLLATFNQAFGQRATSVLFYGPNGSTEALWLPPGATFTVADEDTWRGMTISEFAQYDLIIIGDPSHASGPAATNLLAAYDTRNIWATAITGRIVVSGMDPGFHASVDQPGAGTLLASTLDWLTKGPVGKTALFVSSDWGRRNLDFLSPFGAFNSTAVEAEYITITNPNHPTMNGSTDTSLSWWEISAHSFLTYPASFSSLATGTNYDSSTGSVVVAREAMPSLSLTVRPSANELILSWPTNAVGFALQTTFSLTPPVIWMDFTNPPAVIGAQFMVTNNLSKLAQFYRLRKP
jgi:hypothetical protein